MTIRGLDVWNDCTEAQGIAKVANELGQSTPELARDIYRRLIDDRSSILETEQWNKRLRDDRWHATFNAALTGRIARQEIHHEHAVEWATK